MAIPYRVGEKMKLKTLKELTRHKVWFKSESFFKLEQTNDEESPWVSADSYAKLEDLREEAIKWIKNLQSKETEYPLILKAFPEEMKGSLAKDLWLEEKFRYGAEYGMLAFIVKFFNISKEEL